ncbi:PIG-L family deacetylase [Cryobacterium sp. MLB-32]|uniref:PIG-L family deacetylase n=1 Tax=Cryobacterium sp. MLB-32 TaxID=1529318 RepID=UPI000A86DA25|nr:PIG-L family deacetylase [Cryobacterium sp. MLB-32]
MLVLSNGDRAAADADAPERLAAIRRLDVMTAVAVLAPDAAVRLLELPDGALTAHVRDAAAAISAELEPAEPGTWIVAPWRADGDPDHIAAGDAAADAAAAGTARLFEYPISAWHWSSPTDDVWPEEALCALDLSPEEREVKLRALGRRQSHGHEPAETAGGEPIANDHVTAHFTRGYETFIEAGTVPGAVASHPEPTPVRTTESLPAPFFDELYADRSDPWDVETRWYERRKRALTLAALPRERFGAVLELGCSTGVLTGELARRCDSLLAVDSADKRSRRLGSVLPSIETSHLNSTSCRPSGLPAPLS